MEKKGLFQIFKAFIYLFIFSKEREKKEEEETIR